MADDMTLKIILHAPTPAALGRARNNAINVMREAPNAQVRIVVNAQAVAAVLDADAEELDALTWLCPVTLLGTNRESRTPLHVLPGAAVLEIARMQQAGWVYIRA
ncbi:MAG: hypothetical protein KJ798_10120 [Gammaproteobacteria bacterium]|uniref:hypothetical protein n=1 Tax=Limnobacter sp. TaxID=2003368 RepID=UPI001D1EB5E9|nr:hypothetical protein [Limnobacter sp.]MBU0783494.1 hypothetical protein [Gammaproteobacteria bacterium]MBU0850714.1 hypothetical protein [Gammaproteobacteria bacterium]MBU1267521.1 hypothetical protein [Gammaproteobacteria bacterium]MBU1527597.1 hypothetical protein [Gammaproteobacteria bacterium]MBU1780726.1 hypothetical protein [Gammaproteobacteria bacterium]